MITVSLPTGYCSHLFAGKKWKPREMIQVEIKTI
jgi:hypothetical protein